MTDKKKARAGKADTSRNDKTDDSALRLDYEGYPVDFSFDGWFNATTSAARFGKRPVDWLRLPSTAEYIRAVREVLGISVEISLIRTIRKGGTWLHPELAVAFARWLDTRFAIWCDVMIRRILRGGLNAGKKAACDRSDTSDREQLLTLVAAIVARHGLLFNAVYETVNFYVGVVHARDMTYTQVLEATAYAARVLAGAATAEDSARIERNRARLGITSSQLELLGGAQ